MSACDDPHAPHLGQIWLRLLATLLEAHEHLQTEDLHHLGALLRYLAHPEAAAHHPFVHIETLGKLLMQSYPFDGEDRERLGLLVRLLTTIHSPHPTSC